MLGLHELVGNGLGAGRVYAAQGHGAITLRAVGQGLVIGAGFGQHFTRQGQVHRAGGVALHHRVRAAHHLFGHHAAGQGVLPLDVRAHEAGNVKRVLHKMHVVVARTGQFATQGERGFAGH